MSKFDNTVNLIMEKMFLEENGGEEQRAAQIIDKVRNDVKSEFDADPQKFLENADSRINTYNSVADSFVNYIGDLYSKYKTVNEEADWLKDVTAKVTDYAKTAASAAGGMIGGATEKVLDFLTDQAVEKMPSIVRGVMGDANYEAARNEVQRVDDDFLYKVFAFIDPTGILSWPYLQKAREEYEAHLGTEEEDIYTLNLLAAAVAVVPGVSALKIFALPLKILSPLKGIIGARRASAMSRELASVLKTEFGLTSKMGKAGSVASKTGKVGAKAIGFLKSLGKISGATAKLAASVGKGATIVASGDIPETIKKWSEAGKSEVGKPVKGTLGSFPSFGGLSTQKF